MPKIKIKTEEYKALVRKSTEAEWLGAKNYNLTEDIQELKEVIRQQKAEIERLKNIIADYEKSMQEVEELIDMQEKELDAYIKEASETVTITM